MLPAADALAPAYRIEACGLYWVPAGMIAAIVGAVINAWVLLVEILR